MSLRGLAESDSTKILDLDGDEIIITSPEGDTYTLKGQYVRRGTDIDPGTGLPIQGNVSAFTVSLSALVLLGISDFEAIREGWTISALDVTGATVKARVNKPILDRTIGRITILAKV